MTTPKSSIHTNVMRRVRTIYLLRTVGSGAGVSFLIFGASLYFIGRKVFVAQVFQNMPQLDHLAAVARFFASAFASTDTLVQVLVLLSAFAMVWMTREAGRILFVRQAQFA